MELSPRFVGAVSKSLKTSVTWRHAMNYAAAVGDGNPFYFDDEREGGIIAPPMLAVALTWPIAEHMPQFWPADGFPLEVLQRQVHMTEHLIWHRTMRPGDALTITGEAVAIAPRRGGTLLAIRFDPVDEAGAPVFTEYVGAFLRRVRCAGEATGEENLPEVPSFEPDGSPLWEVPIHIDPLAAHVFDGCGGLHFPIHTSKRFARSVGLPRTILQGTATLSLAVRELTNRELDGDPNRLRSLACEFTGLVLPGTPITVRVLGREQTGDTGRLFFDVLNAEEKKAITDGYATYAL